MTEKMFVIKLSRFMDANDARCLFRKFERCDACFVPTRAKTPAGIVRALETFIEKLCRFLDVNDVRCLLRKFECGDACFIPTRAKTPSGIARALNKFYGYADVPELCISDTDLSDVIVGDGWIIDECL